MQKRVAYVVVLAVIALSAIAAAVVRLHVPQGPVIYGELRTAPGLREGATVSFRGIAVGRVTRVAFGSNAVRLTIALQRADVPIRSGDEVAVRQSGLLGDMRVEIIPAASPGPPLPVGGVLYEADPDAFRRAWLRKNGIADPTAPQVNSGARARVIP